MFTAIGVSLMLGLASPQEGPPPSAADPVAVEDVTVIGRRLRDGARRFVDRVAAPSVGRGLARWRGPMCPGAVNLRPEIAQPILDRIDDAAVEAGVTVGEPGCRANLVIVFAEDGAGLAQRMVEDDPKLFRLGVSGLDQGPAALRAFQQAGRPVRWWPLSVPTDSATGQRAIRLPGDPTTTVVDDEVARALGCKPHDCFVGAAPIIGVQGGASRINSQIEDRLYKVIVIVDIDRVQGLDTGQLGDYLAFVGLAQVDGDGDYAGLETVLNLFNDPASVQGMSLWDRAYLKALYGMASQRRLAGAQATVVAGIMARDLEAPAD